jgi:hypothetical protein
MKYTKRTLYISKKDKNALVRLRYNLHIKN